MPSCAHSWKPRNSNSPGNRNHRRHSGSQRRCRRHVLKAGRRWKMAEKGDRAATLTVPKLGEPKQHVPVFVGSTYEDLKEYREAVREALHRLETIVHGMEYFGSKPNAPKEECLKAVNASKAYIGIFAMRYGSIDPESGKSMTHVEYDEAQRLRLPTLIYIIDEERQPVLPKFVDTGEKATKLYDLKEEIKKHYQVSFFTTPNDLAKRVAQDLPSVLQRIGVVLEREPEALVQ